MTGGRQRMIAVAGEALIDLVVRRDGAVSARPGGGPYNTARTLARLGQPATFLGRLADDGFGRLLRDGMERDGVRHGVPAPSRAPTTLAAVTLDEAGTACYRFYLDGTSAADLDYPMLAAALRGATSAAGLYALHAGAVALALATVADATELLITRDLPAGALLMIDPNCRRGAISDPGGYRDRLFRILRRTDVVKASTEDLDYLFPGEPAPAAVKALLAAGPALVLVTDGPRPARAVSASGEVTAEVPAVRVADTIGAGDAFGAAFLAWWAAAGGTRSGLTAMDQVRLALQAAVTVAALTCTRPGADPPRLADVPAGLFPA